MPFAAGRHPNSTIMVFDNRATDRKTNLHGTYLCCKQGLEHVIKVSWVDACALIFD
jgi:hypothetical protein